MFGRVDSSLNFGEKEAISIYSFDGQTVWLDKDQKTPLFEVGNFLGGGAAGTVYECEHTATRNHYALKILNPIGYKILSPALLRRCNIVAKGKVLNDNIPGSNTMNVHISKENIWWLINGVGGNKQYIACFFSERYNSLRELSLNQCIQVWGTDPPGFNAETDDSSEFIGMQSSNSYLPNIPTKFSDFIRKRNRIFREIRNMRKISNHQNVIRLEGVLELTQESKCTIFLLMELANGGELFDRIKIDCGTREETATLFFHQLLLGVKHCHDQGVCHRDLKPENLLLQDTAGSGTILKIADFGFSARFAMPVSETENIDDTGIGSNTWISSSLDRDNISLLRQQQQTMNSSSVGGGGVNTIITPSSSLTALSLHTSPQLRLLKSVVGSPFYVAPEVMQAKGYDGPKADIWSLGVILYAMLAGNLPFGQELSTCKRFRHFCKWIREQQAIRGSKFLDDINSSNIEYPQWLFPAKFSNLAKGLIVSMLHPDPNCRINLTDAMLHPLNAVLMSQQRNQLSEIVSQQLSVTPSNHIHSMGGVYTNTNGDVVVLNNGGSMQIAIETSNATHETMETEIPDLSMMKDVDEHLRESGESLTGIDDNEQDNDDDMDVEIFKMEDDENEYKQSCTTKHPTINIINNSSKDRVPMIQSPFKSINAPTTMKPGASDGAIEFPTFSSSQPSISALRNTPPLFPTTTSTNELGTVSEGILSLPIMDDLLTVNPEEEDNVSPISSNSAYRQHISHPNFGRSVSGGSSAASHQQSGAPPSFHDFVKKSTRFITAVPASEVLDKVETILEQFRFQKTQTPIGLIGKIEMNWDRYRLEVWGTDTLGPSLCALQLYQMPMATGVSVPNSPDRNIFLSQSPASSSPYIPSYLVGQSAIPQQQLYLVEFIRGQLEIFAFKRFYQWVRQKLSELVKRDYSIKLFDQASSPM